MVGNMEAWQSTVYCIGLENRQPSRVRGFESHRFLHKKGVSKMTYYVAGALLDVYYECEACGASGIFGVDGEENADNSYAIWDFVCPECGQELER